MLFRKCEIKNNSPFAFSRPSNCETEAGEKFCRGLENVGLVLHHNEENRVPDFKLHKLSNLGQKRVTTSASFVTVMFLFIVIT